MDLKETIKERYRIHYDAQKGCFRILDCWHDTIKNIADLTQDIPDDSPAIKIINQMEANALISELLKLGWLDKIVKEKPAQGQVKEERAISLPKDIKEIAIENIKEITEIKTDPSVIKEAILTIREIILR